jgi:hypothetical protein
MAKTTERPTRLEVNCETSEQKIIELTDEEIAQLEADRATAEAQRAEQEAAEQAKATAKAAGLAKLAALGLTAEEAAAIAG